MIKVGDAVIHKTDPWQKPVIVERFSYYAGEKIAHFKDGRFWCVSQLMKSDNKPPERNSQ